eukprot:GHUV01033761.1.p1 GENE.GHUV01033761.1~~GHUV01033761.1.p1  ORF type:complete len:145 (-),score=33.86 GHUV01033761.1:967-1401(-)
MPVTRVLLYCCNDHSGPSKVESSPRRIACLCHPQGPLVLPWSELLTYAANSALRQAAKACQPLSAAVPQAWLQLYTPDFRKAFDYFCIHTGGRGIIDGLEQEMSLSRLQVEPSRASLYRFGNTSNTRWATCATRASIRAGLTGS